MNILITGATGYIGSRLAHKLAEAGHRIHALYRSESLLSLIQHPNIIPFKGDILNIESLENAIKSCKQIYHVAAFARTWAKNPQTYYDINLQGAINVFEAALKNGSKRVVFTSTAGVLGPSTESPIDEETPRLSGFLNEYEDSKFQAEQKAKVYTQKGIEVVTVNPPRVYGPGLDSPSNPLTKMIRLYIKGKWHIIPGDGSKTGCYVYVDDVVQGHILAMEKGTPGERYILGGVNASYEEFFNTLKKKSGKNYKLYKLPVWIMIAASAGMVLCNKLTGKAPLITPKWVKKYNYHWSLSSQKAVNELGYNFISLDEGMERTINWLKKKEFKKWENETI